MGFREVTLKEVEAFGVKSPQGTCTQLIEVDENGEVVTRYVGCHTFTSVREKF